MTATKDTVETKLVKLSEISINGTDHRIGELGATEAGKIESLAAAMDAVGQLQPIRVQRVKAGKYLVVFGRRRFLAAKKLKWETIRAEVVAELGNVDAIDQASVENVQREALNYLEEAEAVAGMVESLGKDVSPKVTGPAAVKAVAVKLGKSETWVRDRMFLTRLGPAARKPVLERRLPLAQAREISKLADPELQADIAEQAACDDDGTHGMSLDWVRNEVAQNMRSLKVVPWELAVKYGGGPACSTCPHNSANAGDLFEHDKKSDIPEIKDKEEGDLTIRAGVCLNGRCFERKQAEAGKQIKAAVTKAGKLIKAGDMNSTGAAAVRVLELAPKGLKATTVANAIRRDQEAPAKPAKKPDGWTQKATPEQAAESKVSDAVNKLVDGLQRDIYAKLKVSDGLRLMFDLLLNSATMQDAHQYDRGRRVKCNQSPAVAAAIGLLEKPCWDNAIKLSGDRDFRIHDIYLGELARYPDCWPVLQRIAKAFKLELGDRPVVKDFLPAPALKAGKA